MHRSNDGYGQSFSGYGDSHFQPRGRARGSNSRGNRQRGNHYNRPPRGGYRPNFSQNRGQDDGYMQNQNLYDNSNEQHQVNMDSDSVGPINDQHRYHYEQYDENNSLAIEQVPEYAESYRTQGSHATYQWNKDADNTDYQQYDTTAVHAQQMDQTNSHCQQGFETYDSYQPHAGFSQNPSGDNVEGTTYHGTTTAMQPVVQTDSTQSGPIATKTDETKKKEEKKIEEEEEEESDEEDTGFCKYCKLKFPTPRAYHAHTRGMQHTTLVMEAKAKQGDKRFQKEVVAPEVLSTTTTTQPIVQTDSKQSVPTTTKTEEAKKKEEAKNEEEEEEESDEEDTGFCKYCKLKFPTPRAYHAHTRGMQHTTLVMEAKAKQGDKRFQKEVVAPEILKIDIPAPASQERKLTSQPRCSTSQAGEDNKQEEEEDSEEEDTGYCKYCKIKFISAKAYHAHTRGIQHTTLVMEAKARKGDMRFQKEIVAPEVLETYIPPPQPDVPQVTEEEEAEEDWLDLDNNVVDYLKKKKKVEDRDLDFEELGKRSDNYNCPLCDIFCTGPAAFKSHLEGKAHKYKLQMAEQGAMFKKKKAAEKVTVVSQGRPSKLSELIEDNPAPMLGLNYITEIQQSDYKQIARYVCNLCESKMDQYAIVNHLVGTKHRLRFMKNEKPDIYDHLTKYNSKRKKSEINAACEGFAEDVEKKEGRGQVKVKIQLEGEEGDKAGLEDSMQKAAKELKEKVYHLEKRNADGDGFNEDDKWAKKARLDERGRGRGHNRDDLREPEPRFMDWGRPWERDFERGRDRYWERERDFYRYGEPGYHRGRDPYDLYHHRMEYEQMDERRLYDERRYLDSQMLDRYRLDDPYLERRRMDDIMARRDYLDELERGRIARVEERRKLLEETDPDLLRLKRYELRQGSSSKKEEASKDSAVEDNAYYRPSFEEIQARRRQKTEIAEKLLERPKVDTRFLSGSYLPPLPPPSSQPPLPPEPVEESLAQRVLSSKSVQEEAAKNPGVNVSELLSKLSSSMIASEDEAAMALQISSALTQALLSYRLQKNPKELMGSFLDPPKEEVAQSIPGLDGSTSQSQVPSFLKTSVQTVQADYNIQTSAHPSYYGQTVLNTAQPDYSTVQTGYPVAQTGYNADLAAAQTGYTTAQTGYPVVQTGYAVPQTGVPAVSIYQANNPDLYNSLSQAVSYAQAALPAHANAALQAGSHVSHPPQNIQYISYQNPMPPTVSQSYPLSQPSSVIGPAPAPPVTPSTMPVAVSETQTAIANVSVSNLVRNTDQPQKHILESIRKQTELLKKKIQLATAGRPISEVLTSQSSTITSPIASIASPMTIQSPHQSVSNPPPNSYANGNQMMRMPAMGPPVSQHNSAPGPQPQNRPKHKSKRK